MGRLVVAALLLLMTITRAQDRETKQKKMSEKIDAYKKSELSESRDMCKQCEFVVARLSNHVLAAADPKEPLPSRDQWLSRMPRYCEPMNTKACLQFLKLYSGLIADDLADLSQDARDLGEDEPSLSNEALRTRICDDVTEACQKHHNVIRSNDIALVVRNNLLKTSARLFWMRFDDGVATAVVPESMANDHVIPPGDRVKVQAKRGQQFVVLPDGINEDLAPRLVVRSDGPKEQLFELRFDSDLDEYDLLYLSDNTKKKKSTTTTTTTSEL